MTPEETTDTLIKDLRATILDNKDAQMNIVISRIPLLCKSVLDIHETLKELKAGQQKIDDRIESRFVSHDQFMSTKEKVDSISSSLTWIIRLILGAVVLAGLGLILVVKK